MLALHASLIFLIGATAVHAAPSFNCAKAVAEAEFAICQNTRLSDLDAGIARAYAAALARHGDPLKDDQRSFLAIRDAAYGLPDQDLAERLLERLKFLERVAAAREGGPPFAGIWENSFGMITIVPAANGKMSVSAKAVDPVSARWICDTTAVVAPERGELTFTDADTGEEATAKITLRRQGSLLVVSEDIQPNAIRGYCGARGALEGAYFRTAP